MTEKKIFLHGYFTILYSTNMLEDLHQLYTNKHNKHISNTLGLRVFTYNRYFAFHNALWYKYDIISFQAQILRHQEEESFFRDHTVKPLKAWSQIP